jgi:hypothetical protein
MQYFLMVVTPIPTLEPAQFAVEFVITGVKAAGASGWHVTTFQWHLHVIVPEYAHGKF